MVNEKRIYRIIIFSILGLILLFVATFSMPFSFVKKPKEKNLTYEYVMRDVFKDRNPKITEIAILGAHDSFTADIKLSSKANTNENSFESKGFINALGKGFVVRMSRTQNASCKELLYAGVRYLDARVALLDGDYYAVHGYRSNLFNTYLQDLVDFLGSHSGEMVIFDIQGFSTINGKNRKVPSQEYLDLFDYIKTIKNSDNKSLFDYVFYDTNTDYLKDLTYNDVTNNKTSAGVIILAKTSVSSYVYNRDSDARYDKTYYWTIRSKWHDNSGVNNILNAIDKEYQYLLENPANDVLVANQALQNFKININLLKTYFDWSLLDMAKKLNKELVKDEDRFKRWLEVMPIFITDYTTSTYGNFNKLANQYILEYNQSL